jgi:hypothetical protein
VKTLSTESFWTAIRKGEAKMTKPHTQWTLGLLVAAAVSLTLTPAAWAAGGKSLGKPSGVVPATVEHISGSDLYRVTLTEKAMERTDVQTTTVKRATNGSGASRLVVPYSSIIYDPHGGVWVYTSPQERTFVRHKIVVDDIEGDNVYLSEGPAVGTTVASVGVAEIYGAEFEIGH